MSSLRPLIIRLSNEQDVEAEADQHSDREVVGRATDRASEGCTEGEADQRHPGLEGREGQ
jgi:hypothetical protein